MPGAPGRLKTTRRLTLPNGSNTHLVHQAATSLPTPAVEETCSTISPTFKPTLPLRKLDPIGPNRLTQASGIASQPDDQPTYHTQSRPQKQKHVLTTLAVQDDAHHPASLTPAKWEIYSSGERDLQPPTAGPERPPPASLPDALHPAGSFAARTTDRCVLQRPGHPGRGQVHPRQLEQLRMQRRQGQTDPHPT